MDAKIQERNIEVTLIRTEPSTNGARSTKRRFFHIDGEMLSFKIHFFLFVGALGVVLPYMVVFAKYRIGLSTTTIAVYLTVQQFLFLLTKPLIGYIADYFHKLKAIIFALTTLQMVFLFILLAIPKLDSVDDAYPNSTSVKDWYAKCKPLHFEQFLVQDIEKDLLAVKTNDRCITFPDPFEDSAKSSSLSTIPPDVESPVSTKSNYSFLQRHEDANRSCSVVTKACVVCCDSEYSICDVFACSPFEWAPDYETYQFWLFAAIFTLAEVCINALFTLSDTGACESVAKTGGDFGRQRLFGAVGWGLAAATGGYLNDLTQDYLASFILMVVLTVLALMNIYRMEMVEPQFSQNILKDVGTVLTSKEYMVFAFSVFFCGMGTGIIWFYLVWFLTSIGGSSFLCGMAYVVQNFIGEIPFMFFSGWLIKKLGHYNLMTLAACAYCIRMLCYSQLHDPWLVLPVECLHGFTYGVFYPALATYSKLSAKPGSEATTQSISFTIHEGLGAPIGTLLAGYSIDRFGTHQTFLFASIFAACVAVVGVILQCLFIRRTDKKREHSPNLRERSSIT